MNDTNAQLVTGLILQGLMSVQTMVAVQAKAQAEGRDVNLAELQALRADDKAVATQLDAAIAAHGG